MPELPPDSKGDDLLRQYKKMAAARGQAAGTGKEMLKRTEAETLRKYALTPDKRSVDKAEKDIKEQIRKRAKGIRPLSHMEERGVRTAETETGETTEEAPAAAETAAAPSTRENQKQVNRVGPQGQKIQPRLAEDGRVQPQTEQPSLAAAGARGALKKAAKNALPVALPLGSGLAGGIISYFIT